MLHNRTAPHDDDLHDTTRLLEHGDGVTSPIVLQATKVAIHVRPRSPAYSPAKYVAVDAASGPQQDDRIAWDNAGRHARGATGDAHYPMAASGTVGAAARRPHITAAITLAPSAAGRGTARGTVAASSGTHAAPGNTARRTSGEGGRNGQSGAARPAETEPSPPLAQPLEARHQFVGAGGQRIGAQAAEVPAREALSRRPAASASMASASMPLAAAVTAAAAPPGVRGAGAAFLAELLGPAAGPMGDTPTRQEHTTLHGRASHPQRTAGATVAMSAAQAPGDALSPWPVPSLQDPRFGMAGGAAAGGAGAGAGYLDVPDPEEEARRARRRHRKRVARIVVDHWKAFAAERLRALAARRHHHRRLLTAAWVAWQAEVGGARARFRQAAVHDLKRAYLGLGRCVKAWSAVAKRLVQLRALEEQCTEARLQRQARSCLRAWRWRCHYAAEKRRRQLQAWYYWCFATLTRALRKWHAWAVRRRAKAQRDARMDSLHAASLCRKVFEAWRRRRRHLQWKAGATAQGAAFYRVWALRRALRGWRDAAAGCAAARQAGCGALAAAASRLQAHAAAAAFREWQAYAAGRRRRRQRERYSQAYMRRWWQLVAMWAWRQQAARERHLRRCGVVLAQVGTRVRLALSWSRWCVAVEVLQGQRSAELRAAVQLRASWAAWRALVEHRATKRELMRLATQRVGRVVAAAALAVWRARAAHWRGKAARWHCAASWHRTRALKRLMAGWRREAARLASKAVAMEAAEEHRRHVLLRRALRVWRQYAWRQRMKEVCAEHYVTRMARGALHGWLRHTRYKARIEINRRRAVRHRYLTLLHSGLHAFRFAVKRRGNKLAGWADLARLYELRLAQRVMAAWRSSFVPAAAAKRAVLRRAWQHWRAGVLRRAVAAWREEAARLAAKRALQRQASGHAALVLLRRVLRRWAAAPALQAARREAAAQRLAELAAALAGAKARRVLAAWREVHGDLVMKRFQDARARAAWRLRVLTRALTCWASHLAHRRQRRLLHATAAASLRLRRWRRCLAALAEHAVAARAKRRLAAVAERHRRMGLLRRGIAALVWYARYRAAKAQGYAAARATYVRRLQREGAAAWLAVGLERRQRRIETLAAAQARSLARQLSRVEPFARRWLYIVRTRRRERLLAEATYSGAAAALLSGSLSQAVKARGGAAGTEGFTGGLFGASQGFPQAAWAQRGAAATAKIADVSASVRWQQSPPRLSSPPRLPHQPLATALPTSVSAAPIPSAVSPYRRPPPRTPALLQSAVPQPGHQHQASVRQPATAAALVSSRVDGSGAGGYAFHAMQHTSATLAAVSAIGAGAEGLTVQSRVRPQPRCPAFLQQQQQQQQQRPATVGGPAAYADVRTAIAASYRQAPSDVRPTAPVLPLQSALPGARDGGPSPMPGGMGAYLASGIVAASATDATAGRRAGGGSSQGLINTSVSDGNGVLRPHTVGGPSSVAGAVGAGGSASINATARRPAAHPLFFTNLAVPPSGHATGAGTASTTAPRLAVLAPTAGVESSLGGGGFGSFWQPSARTGAGGGDGLQPVEGHTPSAAAASPSAGITIHRPGPHPPDVLRLPTRGGDDGWPASSASHMDDSQGYGTGGRVGDGGQAGGGVSALAQAEPWSMPGERMAAESRLATTSRSLQSLARSPTHPALLAPGQPGGGTPSLPTLTQFGDMAAAPPQRPLVWTSSQLSQGDRQRVQPAAAESAIATHGSSANTAPVHLALEPNWAHSIGASASKSADAPAGGHAAGRGDHAAQEPSQRAAVPQPPEVDVEELAELESVLLHCRSLKAMLQQLEGQQGDGTRGGAYGDGGGTGTAAGVGVGLNAQEATESGEEGRRQAAEIREALAALRPTVEYAAARLRQLRGLG